MKKEVCKVINHFLSFLRKYDERRTHNMVCLMLDRKYKSLKLRCKYNIRKHLITYHNFNEFFNEILCKICLK
jgi:hypothetical protein